MLPLCAHTEDIAESIPAAADRAHVTIIIDDLGYSMPPAEAILQLAYPLTLAIIPFTPYGKRIAQAANAIEKEVMLHAPMETLATNKWENGLSVSMDEIELLSTMDAMLTDIPYVVGVNNHGGSKLTQDHSRMDWVMNFLAQRQLFFIDSRTTAASIAVEAAKNNAIAYSERDVFIDNEKSQEYIENQLQTLFKIALKQGKAIGIGHPYPETSRALQNTLPQLQKAGIRLVSASKMVGANNTSTSLAFEPAKTDQKPTRNGVRTHILYVD